MSALSATRTPTWRNMLAMARSRPGFYLAHVALWTVIHVSPLVPGLIARAFFDTLTGRVALPVGTDGLIVLLVIVALARSALYMAGGFVETITRFVMSGQIRHILLRTVLDRPGARALPGPVGETISRFRDDAYAAEDSLDWLNDVIGTGLFAVGAFAIMMRVDARVTLVVFLPLLTVVAIARRASAALGQRRAASSQATSDVTAAIGDIVGAAQVLQAAGAEERAIARFRRLSERRRATMLADRVLTQALDAITANTVSIGTGLVMLLAAGNLRDGSMTVGDFVLFIAYLGFIAEFTDGLGRFLAHYQQTGVAFQRMDVLMAGGPEGSLVAHAPLYLRGPLPDLPRPPRATDRLRVLEARGLTYHHPETGQGIEGIDLRVERGTLTVVTGRVGAGKTTLLRALLGLLPAEAGEVRWNSDVVHDPASFLVPPRAAYTAQVPRLFSETLRQNILLGWPDHPQALADALYRAVLDHDVEALEAGLETPVGTRGVRLSGGQVQRTAAARMLVRGADLLVIDDLSSALDVETERLLWERLLADRGVTCLAVSHRRATLARADRIVLMENGRVEAVGTLDDLLASSVEMRALWSEAAEGVRDEGP